MNDAADLASRQSQVTAMDMPPIDIEFANTRVPKAGFGAGGSTLEIARITSTRAWLLNQIGRKPWPRPRKKAH